MTLGGSMTPVQASIFDAPITAGTARRSDPITSHLAAQQVKPGKAHAAIIAHLAELGGSGTLDDACDALPKLLRSSVSRRLSDLEAMGRIRKSGRIVSGEDARYGQPLIVWELQP